MTDPYSLYRSLNEKSAAIVGGFSAVPFPDQPAHRVAANAAGDPVILIETQRGSAHRTLIPIRTENIAVVFSTPYRARYPSGDVREEVFTAVTCLNADPPIVRYFFSLFGALMLSLGPKPRVADVEAAVRTASQLFQALAIPARNTAQGVWAELLVLASSQDRARAVAAWHAAPEERYDFAVGAERLEVKSSGHRRRHHHFSLEQLLPPEGAQLWIASLFVERSAGGLTLEALLDEVTSGLEISEGVKVRRIAAETLGASFTNALEMGFDRQLAVESLRYYSSAQIPRVATPLPSEVSDVHFRSDLTGITPAFLSGTTASIFPAPGTEG